MKCWEGAVSRREMETLYRRKRTAVAPAQEQERNRGGGDISNTEVTWKVTFSAELTLQAPQMLLVLESCFLDEIDCTDLLENVPMELLLKWVLSSSCILPDGLNRMNYWGAIFSERRIP
jgi:hypothetical protein